MKLNYFMYINIPRISSQSIYLNGGSHVNICPNNETSPADITLFPRSRSPLGVFKNDEVSKIDDPGIVSHGFDLAESKYGG